MKKHKSMFLKIQLVIFITFNVTSGFAEVPVSPPGTNTQSWLGNTFSNYTNSAQIQNVPEELEDIKLGNGILFFAGYHERGGGGAAFKTTDGTMAGRYDGFGSGFGSPVKSVAADANNVYFGTPGQGVQKYVYGGATSPISTILSGKAITGLCIKNGKMYISNWTDNKVHVYSISTMTQDASWAVTNPTRLAVDNNGKIWVIQWDNTSPQNPLDGPMWYGKNILSYSNTGVQGASITNFEKPKCLAVDGSNQLLVGGLNQHSQIWKYGDLTGTPSQTGTFGELNGIFSGTAGQFTTSAKLHWVSGIDVDALGNIYVACRYGSFWGSAIEKFNSAGVLQWRNICGSSLDCAGIDPDNETEVYSKFHHYSLDYSKTAPGSEWSLKGFTVNRFKYPNDNRVNFLSDVGERSLGKGVVRVQGKLFLLRSQQNEYMLEIYRFDNANNGEVAIPSVRMPSGTNHRIYTYNNTTSRWDSILGNPNYNEYFHMSNTGDIYTLAQISFPFSHLIKYPFQGFDSFGNPIYNISSTTPIPGNSIYRASGLSYDDTSDCMYLIASKLTDSDGDNKYIRCIQNINSTMSEKWTVAVPFNDANYIPGANFGAGKVNAIYVAGDYVFLAYGYGHIRILNKLTGALVGTLTQNANGWVGTEGQIDAKCGLNVTKRSNGEYVILFENATLGNIQMHRWNPDIDDLSKIGTLTGTFAFDYTDVNLSLSTADWKHFTNKDHKSSGSNINSISDFATIGGVSTPYADDLRKISWSDGTPTASSTNNQTGVSILGSGNGFSFIAAARNDSDTLKIYVSGNAAGGTLTAHLSNAYAPDFVKTVAATRTGKWDGTFTLIYNAKEDGKTLDITWVQAGGSGSIALQAAGLFGKAGITSVENLNMDKFSIEIYPNPFEKGELTIKMNENDNKTISIIDISGKSVYKTQSSETMIQVPRSLFNRGAYLVSVCNDENIQYKKIIIIK